MNRFLQVLVPLVLGVTLSLSLTQPASGAPGALSGTWTSADPDGSSQVMTITGSGQRAYAIFSIDSVATLCGGNPAQVVGPASVVEEGLISLATVTCIPGGNVLGFRV